MKHVEWAAAATTDLQRLRDFYDDPDTADRLIERIVLSTDWLRDWPFAGSEIGASGWRKWKPRRTPHIPLYRSTGDGIEIGRVRHERENWMADL